jgi:hypothetical protein
MYVIDLLSDHAATPEWEGLKTLLPYLMAVFRHRKLKTMGYLQNLLRSLALQITTEFSDASIAGIRYQVEMIRHQYIDD